MKLGKVHLVGSLIMTACAMVYTVSSMTRSAPVSQAAIAATAPLDAPAPSVQGTAPAIDPTQLPPVPDVALDRLPTWPRNPFDALVVPELPAATLEVEPVLAIAAEDPDVVVTAILFSSSRRVAMVNGTRVTVGERIGTETVVEILPNAVVLESPVRGRRTVERRSAARGLR